jgi:ABC-type transport system substrate-binding protein
MRVTIEALGKTSFIALLAAFLAACGVLGGGEGVTQPPEAVTQQPTEGPPPTPTPEPFKTNLVMCTAEPVPTSAYGDPSAAAQAVYDLTTPRAVRYGDDYVAEAGELLTELPTFENGGVVQNDDGTFTIRLSYNTGFTWSDGEPFTLEDARRGLLEPASPFGPRIDVRDAVIDGDSTIIITAGPNAEYPYVPSQPPLPTHIIAEGEAGQRPSTTPSLGIYSVQGEQDGTLTFAPNEFYTGTIPFQQASLRVLADANTAFAELQSGNCDLVLDGSLGQFQVDLLDITEVTLAIWPGQTHERILFNTYIPPESARVPYFADARVRQAMALAINHRQMSNFMTDGIGTVFDSWLPAEHWAYAGGVPTDHDPAAAQALLREAGWQDSNGDGALDYQGGGGTYACQRGEWSIEPGTTFEPVLLIPADDFLRDNIAGQLERDLAEVGIALTVERVPADDLFGPESPLLRRSFDWVLFSDVTRPDPGGVRQWVGADVYRHPTELNVVHRWQLEERWLQTGQLVERLALDNTPSTFNDFQGQNYGGWCHEEANIAIVEANLPRPTAERVSFYATHQQVFAEEVPSLPLFGRPRVAAHASYLCGVTPGPVEPLTWNASQWRFDETGACD